LLPHDGQNLKFGGIIDPHLPHCVPTAVPGFVIAGVPFVPGAGGCTDARFWRGSSATGCPQRAHCGTPIGVNALHASQTNPTSISLGSYPVTDHAVKERRAVDRLVPS
jgi:hypothetical protein